jgi:N-dimethylarginine dimethylaminohydrolase
MCRPDHFAIEYAINPWMDPDQPPDLARALHQWDTLRRVYLSLGHDVEVLEPEMGLPDMVFTANGATIAAGRALGVRFAHAQRQGEEALFLRWLRAHGFPDVVLPREVNEGQGDLLPWSGGLLGGFPLRTTYAAHAEAAGLLGVAVTSLELVDPRFYHLDTALMVLDDTVAYLPEAFSDAAAAVIRELFPDALRATPAEAARFALNGVCDGRNVVMTDEAPRLAHDLAERGYEVIALPFDEFRKSGGGIKCATLLLDWPGLG